MVCSSCERATGFGNGERASWDFLSLRVKSGGWCRDCTHAARRLTRFSGPGHCCSANHPKWSGWQELHLRPPRSEQGRLLLTLHPEIGCQGWTRTNTVRFNKPSCYFDTTWQWLAESKPEAKTGAAGRSSTCIIPFRRRMPRVFDHGSNLKLARRAVARRAKAGRNGRISTCGLPVPSRAL